MSLWLIRIGMLIFVQPSEESGCGQLRICSCLPEVLFIGLGFLKKVWTNISTTWQPKPIIKIDCRKSGSNSSLLGSSGEHIHEPFQDNLTEIQKNFVLGESANTTVNSTFHLLNNTFPVSPVFSFFLFLTEIVDRFLEHIVTEPHFRLREELKSCELRS